MDSKRKHLNDPDSYILNLKKERLYDTEDVQCEMNEFTNFEQPIELVTQVNVNSENDPLAPVYEDKTLIISQETREDVISIRNRHEAVKGKYELKPFGIKTEPGDAFSAHNELDIKYEPIDENCDNCVAVKNADRVRIKDKDTAGTAGTSEMILDPTTGLFVPVDHEIHVGPQAEDGCDYDSTDTADSPLPWIETHRVQPAIVEPSTSNVTPMTPQISSPVSVKMLLTHPFSSEFWTADQRNDILVQHNVPTLYIAYRFPWLCESPELERFFCWPCLLFTTAWHVWSVIASSCRNCGYNCSCNQDFEDALVKHQASVDHQNAHLQCDSHKKIALISLKDRNVLKFHENWKLLVKTICCERKNKDKFLFKGNLKFTEEIQDLIRAISKEHASSSASIKLAEKILSAAGNHLKISRIEDVKSAQYVTLHVRDLSAVVADKTWVVVIARYADQNGCINESVIDFVRTHQAVKYRSAASAIKLLQHLFIDMKLGKNVVGFTYSASIVVPVDVPAFHRGILEWCPNALFYHSPCESFQVSLFQAITHVTACRKYLQEAQELCDFMNEHYSLIKAKESIITKSESCNTVLPKKFDGDFSSKLSLHYGTLLKIFESLVKTNPNVVHGYTGEARRILYFLKNRKNHISIVIISEIFSIVSDLAEAVQKPFDLDLLMQHRINAIRTLTFMRKTGPKIIEQLTCNKILRRVAVSRNQAYVILFHYIIDTAVSFLTHRFENLEQFNYTSSNLVDSTLKLAKYPAHSWDFIKRARLYQNEFTQMKCLIDSESFEDKSLTELLHFIQQTETDEHSGLHKYLLFIHTISLAKTGQRQLFKSVLKFVNEVPTKKQTSAYMDEYFWQMDDCVFKKFVDDPELYQEVLDACKLKIIFVEDECHVTITNNSSYFY